MSKLVYVKEIREQYVRQRLNVRRVEKPWRGVHVRKEGKGAMISMSVYISVTATGHACRAIATPGTTTSEECFRRGERIAQRPLNAPPTTISIQHCCRPHESGMNRLLQFPSRWRRR